MSPIDEALIQTRRHWAGMTRPEFACLEERNQRQFNRLRRLTLQLDAAEKALEPFAHPDLCKLVGGNVQGDASPVFGRDKAILTLGDFRRARKFLRRNHGHQEDR